MTKMIVLGDENTVTGMKLGGLKDCIIVEKDNVNEKIKNLPEDVDIIIITKELMKSMGNALFRMKDKMIIELPEEYDEGEDMISRMIRNVIGFDMKR